MSEYLEKEVFSKPVDPSSIRKSWNERGYSFHQMTDPAAKEWTNFVHSTDELLTVVSGTLKLVMEGTEIVCHPGDEVFIPRDKTHSVYNINGAPTTWIFGYN